MSKRGPTSELNHDNWDQEDKDKETAGEFKQADTNELKKRVILQAKRKSTASSGEEVKTPFSNFTAFAGNTSGTSSPAAKPNFGFLAKSTPDKTNSSTPFKTNGNSVPKPGDKLTSTEYFHQLKSLNVSVSAWIAKHVQTNPYCILTPVFRDYEKHLSKIENQRPQQLETEASDSSAASETDKNTSKEAEKGPVPSTVPEIKEPEKVKDEDESPPATLMVSSGSDTSAKDSPAIEEPSKGATDASPEAEKSPSDTSAVTTTTAGIFGAFGSASTFTFGSAKPATTTASSTPFLFGNTTSSATSLFGTTPSAFSNTTSSAQFSFGSIANQTAAPTSTFSFGNTGKTGFSFGGFAKPAETAENNEEGEENEEPPKVEFKAIEEDDSIYEIKCKVFVMKDKEYVERGLGQLYIKRKDNDSKAQLLVRSAGVTGQILLNVLLTSNLSPKRLGKNNVQMACVAVPGDAAPSIIMIRVKSGEDADELLAKVEEYKK